MSDCPPEPWAKLRREDDPEPGRHGARGIGRVKTWCALIDHSADVAAVFSAILTVPVVAARVAQVAELPCLDPILAARFGVLAAMHDFGKANHGFRNRWNPTAPSVGHVTEAFDGLKRIGVRERLWTVLPIKIVLSWGHSAAPLLMALGHHGYPLQPDAAELPDGSLWSTTPHYDPVASLAQLGAAIQEWYPEAFGPADSFPPRPRLLHLASGLLTLADWIASDETIIPLSPVGEIEGPDRFARIRVQAPGILRRIGFDPSGSRFALSAVPAFSTISPHFPTPVQAEAGTIGQEKITVLESETGSGKTEAALFRFARLFQAGAVDGLYFALPTRVAATALYHRVEEAIARLWPAKETRPAVVLAVPGQGRIEDQGLEGPAGGVDRWTEEGRTMPWAASRPKKFLAGTIAVGTIDQALLAIIKAKHAHLRLANITRHLLVVDEVHASDLYMEIILSKLLRFHQAAGGHALLLSATLGARARTNLLGSRSLPSLAEAAAAPYPALTSDTVPAPRGIVWTGREKRVTLTLSSGIGEPQAIASHAADAARSGAKVLVIRNTRRDAIATFEAIRRLDPEVPVFRCSGVPTLHHGRFAREDRVQLDRAIENAIGKNRPEGALVVIGTQTLEQSLDIDADMLVTDLCPADVLLQRIGRLHRHQRPRPAGYESPRALVLAPEDLASLIRKPAHGLGANDRYIQPYPDLVCLEATLRLVREEPIWTIPAMNRLLVELTTHPDATGPLGDQLVAAQPVWTEAMNRRFGHTFVHKSEAARVILPTEKGFDDPEAYFGSDSDAATRLGARDLLVELPEPVIGPFRLPVATFAVPYYWWSDKIDGAGDMNPDVLKLADGSWRIKIQRAVFQYNALGLRPLPADNPTI